ncbi:MAG: uracil-DNA glycosylase [Erysipelotrichaceae bacterium]|uniref:uracil-DNA glycosylase n=1 Tax=Floccifex sp. TaxID=2815810 RepID=UPI002A74CFFF|nr:uracil-DNA glycosylase [Floccifex sp.]MDD7281639.1 uracil-DNA glycosylase [Erysipelotrichaceae bacterium]MDY2958754.1 uracil-DNA glycosylase [Floccifex sp.]
MSTMNNDWDTLFDQEIQKDYLIKIDYFLAKEYKTKEIYPAKENIFAAFKTTPIKDTKVVILGQDPYHNTGQAQGYAFSVPSDFPLPPSLKNIYKELENEYHVPVSRNGDLTDWAKQGVLLMNTVLTVEAHKAFSHSKIGWQNFTNAALQLLNEQDQPIVFMLWGNSAIQAKKYLNNPNHLVLTSPHPSPLSASRGFFGNNHFKLCNEFLEKHGVSPIQWI